MKYLIIGLGIYGSNLARDLTDMGHEVIGADKVAANVEAIKDYISTAYIIDAADEQSLSVLPIKSVDAVIVAIGENFGASVKTVAILKKIGVKRLFARAIDSLHQAILEGMNVDRILKPEQWAARNLVDQLELGSNVSTLSVSPDTYIMQFDAPEYFVGTKYQDIDLERRFKLKLIAATRTNNDKNFLGMTSTRYELIDLTRENIVVETGDVFSCIGSSKAFSAMMRKLRAEDI